MNISRLSVKFLYTILPLWGAGLLWSAHVHGASSPVPDNSRLVTLIAGGHNSPSTAGKGVRICIVDSGQSTEASVLNKQTKSSFNAFDKSNDVTDNDGHGTASAGIIHQLAPLATLIPVKSFDNSIGTIKTLQDGVAHCLKEKADIVNISGSGIEFVKDYIHKNPEQSADTLFVLSAGNDQSYLPKDPARPDNLIVVGATEISFPLTLTIYSAFGAGVDIYAPAGAINDGLATWTPTNTLRLFNGTSAATPVVSGAAALVKGAYPELSASEIKNLILQSGVMFSTEKSTAHSLKLLNVILLLQSASSLKNP